MIDNDKIDNEIYAYDDLIFKDGEIIISNNEYVYEQIGTEIVEFEINEN